MYRDPESTTTERCNYCGRFADVSDQGVCEKCESDPDVIEDLQNERIIREAFNRDIRNHELAENELELANK